MSLLDIIFTVVWIIIMAAVAVVEFMRWRLERQSLKALLKLNDALDTHIMQHLNPKSIEGEERVQ